MSKNKYLASLVCGFGAAVLTTLPALKAFSCCLIIPLFAALAIYLFFRISGDHLNIDLKTTLFIGVLTGIFAAFFSSFFDVLITYITHTNELVESLPQTEAAVKSYNLDKLFQPSMTLLKKMAAQIKTSGFSTLYAFMILLSNLIINTIFGMLGGIVGMKFINKKTNV